MVSRFALFTARVSPYSVQVQLGRTATLLLFLRLGTVTSLLLFLLLLGTRTRWTEHPWKWRTATALM